jgi:hypothetical protein
VPLSLVWCVINLARLLAALVVLWRVQRHDVAELSATVDARDGVVLLAGDTINPVHGWRLSERSLRAPERRALGGLVLAWQAPSGRCHRLAEVGERGELRPFDRASRGRLIALLVQLTLDREPAYRPGRALLVTLVEMFGLSFRRRTT